ncbi:MAG: hypothetical protein Q8P81_01935 [Nanoarchaeota archaeon]|nr:hypothetical protein [Nanoarchaeota archaeon]
MKQTTRNRPERMADKAILVAGLSSWGIGLAGLLSVQPIEKYYAPKAIEYELERIPVEEGTIAYRHSLAEKNLSEQIKSGDITNPYASDGVRYNDLAHKTFVSGMVGCGLSMLVVFGIERRYNQNRAEGGKK